MKSALIIATTMIGVFCIYTHIAMNAPEDNFDDAEWALKSYVLPSDHTSKYASQELPWEETVPCLWRWISGLAVRVAHTAHEAKWPTFMGPDRLGESLAANRRAHVRVPKRTLYTLRLTNLVLFVGMVASLWTLAMRFLGGSSPLRSCLQGFFAVLPLIISPTFYNNAAWRSGPDMTMLFTSVLALFAWARLYLRGRDLMLRGVALLSILFALPMTAKQNGILLYGAFVLYLLVYSHGIRRALNPILCLGLGLTVFAAVNPAMPITPQGIYGFFMESCRIRVLCTITADQIHLLQRHHLTRADVFLRAAPMLAVLPIIGYGFWRIREQKWTFPLLWWSGVLFFGTLLTIHLPAPRYFAPMEMGFSYAAALCIICNVRYFFGSRRGDSNANHA